MTPLEMRRRPACAATRSAAVSPASNGLAGVTHQGLQLGLHGLVANAALLVGGMRKDLMLPQSDFSLDVCPAGSVRAVSDRDPALGTRKRLDPCPAESNDQAPAVLLPSRPKWAEASHGVGHVKVVVFRQWSHILQRRLAVEWCVTRRACRYSRASTMRRHITSGRIEPSRRPSVALTHSAVGRTSAEGVPSAFVPIC